MAKKLRVYELARELNLDNSEVIYELQHMGVPVTSHSNTVEDRLADILRKKLKTEVIEVVTEPVEEVVALEVEEVESVPVPAKEEPAEMWGAMYASGLLKIKDGTLNSAPWLSDVCDIFRDNGFEPFSAQDKGMRRGLIIYAKGCRFICSYEAPIFLAYEHRVG